MNLVGSPVSFANLTRGLSSESTTTDPTLSPSEAQSVIELTVKNNGYYPATLRAKANEPISLNLVTSKTRSCARDFVIPALKYYSLLPETGRVTVDIPPQEPGTIMRFTCSMGMYTGEIVFDN